MVWGLVPVVGFTLALVRRFRPGAWFMPGHALYERHQVKRSMSAPRGTYIIQSRGAHIVRLTRLRS